jgi:hypothetical protein
MVQTNLPGAEAMDTPLNQGRQLGLFWMVAVTCAMTIRPKFISVSLN